MGIFNEYMTELTPFKEYLDLIFKEKKMPLIAHKSDIKVVHYKRLSKDFFKPLRKTIKDTTERVKELAKAVADAIRTELFEKKKGTYRYLSTSKSEYSYKYCLEDKKRASFGKTVTNEKVESCLGGKPLLNPWY